MSYSRPNILFIFTDDQRYDTINVLGNNEIITPNIDTLVRQGTTFSNAYIMGGTSPAVCMPSRAMLMSGRTLFHLDRQGQNIPTSHPMFPEVLRSSGYTTFATGKWHNGPSSFTRCFSSGSRIFFGGMSDHFDVPLNQIRKSGEYSKTSPQIADKRHSTDLFSESMINFLRSYKGKDPFLAYLSFTAPHDPRETHKKYHSLYSPHELSIPENFMPEHPFDNGELKIRDELLAPWPRTQDVIQQHLADYYAMITHIDDQIGRVMNTLAESGMIDETIVVFSSDNGLAVGQHGLMGKQNIYDHSVHVPLILTGPGIPQNVTRHAFTYLIDIYPTLLDLVGESLPPTVEGKSLSDVLHDPLLPHRQTLFFAYKNVQRGIQNQRYKLIDYMVNNKKETQLFNLQDDPWEMEDISSTNATVVTGLRANLKNWQHQIDDPLINIGD